MKIKKSEKGVSEVIGSILILAITVTMFAVVMLWVISYPTPSGRAYVDLNAEVNGQYVNITHTGGESLEDSYTAIYVYINGSLAGSKAYKISDADNYATIGDSLSVGETWSKTFSISSASTVEVMIVDTEGNEVIYDKTIQGVSGNNKPVVAFACTIPTSVPADGSTTFKVYAYIMDPDKDVSTVTVNLSSVGKSTYSMTSTDKVIFQKSSLTIPVDTSAGRYLCRIDATDTNGNTARGYVWITVTDPSVLGGGGFASEGSSYGDQGFMITNDFNSTTDMRIFNQTDTIWVKMASNVLTNVRINNLFRMKDVYGSTLTPPTSSSAFVYYNYDGGYYFYVYSFDVQNIQGIGDDGGVYPTHIELKDYSWHKFIVDTTIIVKDINGGIPSYGILKTYSNAACTTESTWFDSEGMMYVKVFTKTVGDADSATVGNIEIRDFIGGEQVKRRPGNEPVSNITIDVGGNYSFSINLTNANQDPWLHPGNNTYTLFVRNFTDADESYQNLALQVIIYAPPKMLDIIAGVDGANDAAWARVNYLYFYENDNYWTRTCIDYDPDKIQSEVVSILDVAVGDMDEDGDLDVVGGAEAQYVYLYDNLDGNGGKWNRTTIDDLSGETPDCIEVGDMDGDGALDIVVGTDSNNIYLYLNDGNWTRRTISSGRTVFCIILEYMEGVNDDDLDIIVGRDSGVIGLFLSYGNGTFEPEFYVTGSSDIGGTAVPNSKDVNDTTGGSIADAQTDNNFYYNITSDGDGATLWFNGFDTTGMTGTPFAVTLKAQYNTDSGYNGTGYIQFNNSDTWQNATQPINSTSEIEDTFDLKAAGVDTLAEIANLDVRFHNNDSSGNTTICRANITDAGDTAGTNLTTIADSDLTHTTVNPGDALWLDGFDNTTNLSTPFTDVTLELEYRTPTGYNDNKYFYISVNEGGIWTQTGIQILGTGGNWVTATATGLESIITTVNDVRNLDVYFTHSGNKDVDINSVHLIVKFGDPKLVYFDYIVIEVTMPGGVGGGSANIYSLATLDLGNDGDNDIVSGDANGIVWQSLNDANGRVWNPTTTVADAGSAVNGLDVGSLVGDSELDIAVGTSGGKVYVYENDGIWTPRLNASTENDVAVLDLAVGDMESDGDDDIVIATDTSGQTNGKVYYYENDGNWTGSVVDDCGTVSVYCVAVGDIDG